MPKLINGETLHGDISVTKQSGTKIMLDTGNMFAEKDIELTINVQSGSASTPNTSIAANPTLSINSSTGVVTGTVSTTKSVTPTVSAGYVSTGSSGTMTVSGSNTLSLTTQAAQTITPGTTNQTIAAGKYLIGAQTIAGDSNLVAENIAEGVNIFGITGTHSGGGGAIKVLCEGVCGRGNSTHISSDVLHDFSVDCSTSFLLLVIYATPESDDEDDYFAILASMIGFLTMDVLITHQGDYNPYLFVEIVVQGGNDIEISIYGKEEEAEYCTDNKNWKIIRIDL